MEVRKILEDTLHDLGRVRPSICDYDTVIVPVKQAYERIKFILENVELRAVKEPAEETAANPDPPPEA